jgi:trans-aconitate methyltransferase
MQTLSGRRFASALDVGCGNGELLALLSRAHPEIATLSGADLSPDQVARNRSRFPGIDFNPLNIEKEAIDRRFDLVVCSEVIEHLDEQRAAFGNLAAMVNLSGTLLVTCPTGTISTTERRFGHVRHPTPEQLVDHGAAFGLRPISMLNWGWPAYRLLKWATNINADWAMQRFASGAYSSSAKLVSNTLYWLNYLNRPDDARGCQLVAVFEKPTPPEGAA